MPLGLNTLPSTINFGNKPFKKPNTHFPHGFLWFIHELLPLVDKPNHATLPFHLSVSRTHSYIVLLPSVGYPC
jgi:hypothetical protein